MQSATLIRGATAVLTSCRSKEDNVAGWYDYAMDRI